MMSTVSIKNSVMRAVTILLRFLFFRGREFYWGRGWATSAGGIYLSQVHFVVVYSLYMLQESSADELQAV